jgi:hypothetical protein
VGDHPDFSVGFRFFDDVPEIPETAQPVAERVLADAGLMGGRFAHVAGTQGLDEVGFDLRSTSGGPAHAITILLTRA